MRRASWPEHKLRGALKRGYFRTADLFAGCGGMTLGFHRAGYRCLVAVEQNDNARASHEANFKRCAPRSYAAYGNIIDVPGLESVAHLAKPKTRRREVIDIVIGGSPCQAFSRLGRAALWDIAGKKHAHADDPRATLYEHFLSYVEDLRPIAFVMENVPEIGRFGGKNVAEEIALAAGDLGYVTRYALLNAAWYGVPQFRERMIIIGVRRELDVIPGFPARTHNWLLPSGYATSRAGNGSRPVLSPHGYYVDHNEGAARMRPARTVAQAFRDLPEITAHLSRKHEDQPIRDTLQSLAYRGRPCGFSSEMRSWPDFESNGSSVGHVIRLTPRDYRIFREMRPGDMYPDAVQIAERLFKARLRRLALRGERVTKGSKKWKSLRKEYVPPYKTTQFINKYRKMVPNEPSRTVPAHLGKDCYSHIHPEASQARTISLREAARLQSFPDAFELCGSMNERFTQIGNAVPPLLAFAIASHLRGELRRSARRLTIGKFRLTKRITNKRAPKTRTRRAKN